MPTQTPVLCVREVSKSFGAVAAVRDVSFIAMGRRLLGRFNTIDRVAMTRQAEQLFARLGVSIEPNRPARGSSITSRGLR